MINIDDFLKRIENILEYYGLSASAFADALGVQRSGLSHLMSGRNKPSLDLIMKISEAYPEVDLYWLLNGKGSFPPTEIQGNAQDHQEIIIPPAEPVPDALPAKSTEENVPVPAPDLFSEPEPEVQTKPNEEIVPTAVGSVKIESSSPIEQVLIFYKDGTFKAYTPGH